MFFFHKNKPTVVNIPSPGPATPPAQPSMGANIAPTIIPPKQSPLSVRTGGALFMIGGLLVLGLGLGVGVFLINRPPGQQNISSKASCTPLGWLLNGSVSGDLTQPTFNWTWENNSYGGSGLYVNLYLWSCAAKNSSCQTGFATDNSGNPITSMPFSKLGIGPLGCNQTYYWYAYAGDSCTGSMTQNSNWSFTTPACSSQSVTCDSLTVNPSSGTTPLTVSAVLAGHTTNGGSVASYKFDFGDGTTPVTQAGTTISHTFSSAGSFTVKGYITDDKGNAAGGSGSCLATITVSVSSPVAACQNVTADKDLTKIAIGDTVTFTGRGTVSDSTDQIDKIKFIILKDTTTSVFNDDVAAVVDSGNTYKATKSITITDPGSYSVQIQVHQKTADKWFQ